MTIKNGAGASTKKPVERDLLGRIIFDSNPCNTQIDLISDRRLKGSQLAWAGYAADFILAAGYCRPQLIQYVVVTEDGGVYDCSFGQDRERAQAVADQATADAASVGMNYTYRVAELVEAAQ